MQNGKYQTFVAEITPRKDGGECDIRMYRKDADWNGFSDVSNEVENHTDQQPSQLTIETQSSAHRCYVAVRNLANGDDGVGTHVSLRTHALYEGGETVIKRRKLSSNLFTATHQICDALRARVMELNSESLL